MPAGIEAVQGYRVAVSSKTTWLFLEVVAGDGLEGWGEFTIEAPAASLSAALDALRARVLPAAADASACQDTAGLCGEGPVEAAVVSAFDQAINDIEARRAGRPLAACLAPTSPVAEIPLYANINRGLLDRTPHAFAMRVLEAVAEGFTAIKIAPFDGLSPALCGSAEGRALTAAAFQRVEATREAIGPDVLLLVDCHWRLSESAAAEAIGQLASAKVSWFECPLPEIPDHFEALARLRRLANDAGIRFAGGETFTGWDQFRPLVELGLYDVIMPDVKYAGGLREFLRIAERAAERGVAVSPHNPTGPVCHAASLHVSAALPEPRLLEYQFDESPLFDGILDRALPPRSATSRLPDGSGLGIALRRDRLSSLEEANLGGRSAAGN